MTFGSLFAGVGGIDLGLERAGLECKWQVEHDGYALKVLEKHWPTVPKYRDVRYFLGGKRWRAVRSAWSVDCIAGGFPCIDISNAGKRAGITGKQSGLWSEYARIVRLLRPRFVFVENVPALTIRGLGTVVGDLAALGYDSEWACIPAAAVGAPHPRWRLFLVADRGAGDPSIRGDNGDADGHEHKGHSSARQENRATAESRVRDAPDAESIGRGAWRPEQQGQQGRRHIEQLRGQDDAPDATGSGCPAGAGLRIDGEPSGRRQSAGCDQGDARHAAGRIWQRSRWLEFAAFCESQGRLFWPNFIADVRGISDGLPHQLDGTPEPLKAGVANRVDRLRCLGNAVLPQLAEWIGWRIMEMAR